MLGVHVACDGGVCGCVMCCVSAKHGDIQSCLPLPLCGLCMVCVFSDV